MRHIQHFSKRSILLSAVIPLAIILFTACRPAPKNTGPDIDDIVATGMAGTQHAWALGTIVSATQAALAWQVKTVPPPDTSPPPATAAASDDPCTGRGPGKRSYVDEGAGYCLFYPEDFFVERPTTGGVEFLGPALDKSLQPLRGYINISRKEPVNGRTLDEIAMSVWKDPRNAYRLSNIRLGGKDALVAEDLLLGDAGWKIKQVLFTHKDFIYVISFAPVDTTPPFDKVLPDIQRFWDLAIPSFTFKD